MTGGPESADEPGAGEQPDAGRRPQHLISEAKHQAARILPAWRRETHGEQRWPAAVTVAAAIALQLALPSSLVFRPRWVLPACQALLLAVLVAANPGRITRLEPKWRAVSLALIAVMSGANAWSAVRLVDGLVSGTSTQDPSSLLLTGGAIWITNVIALAVWYWELDRGGPAARAAGERNYPDFLFPQMTSHDLAPPDWEPSFVDYLYVSFTNATAFSPTDVMPLTRWAKLLMLAQSAVSLSTVALVIARAVNILR